MKKLSEVRLMKHDPNLPIPEILHETTNDSNNDDRCEINMQSPQKPIINSLCKEERRLLREDINKIWSENK